MSQWTLNWIMIVVVGAALLYFHPSRHACYAIAAVCLIMALRQDHPWDVFK